MIKILFTSAGRRVELMQAFHRAAEMINEKVMIYGADMSDSAPALAYCDKTELVCRISDDNYIPLLLEICKREEIDALIPTIDTDLLVLSEHKADFEKIGTKLLVSDPEFIRACRDKRKTAEFFVKCGLDTPNPTDNVDNYSDGYPCFIKPLDGSSSINAFRADSEKQLRGLAAKVPDYIIQPFVSGEEYTIDIFCGFDNKPIYITPRKRLAVRSGEVLKTQMLMDLKMIEESKQLLEKFKAVGEITVQLIRGRKAEDTEDRDYYIEINPRYGGGAPLSIKAGAESPLAVLKLLQQVKLQKASDSKDVSGINPGLPYDEVAETNMDTDSVYTRFDQSICVDNKPVEIHNLMDLFEENENTGKKILAGIDGLILDLDDTLYSEKQYVRSGYHKIAISGLIDAPSEEIEETLWNAFCNKQKAIDVMLTKYGISDPSVKEKVIQIYRYQEPEISLYPDAQKLLSKLSTMDIKLGLITDGRSEGQRAKIKALDIEKYFDEIIVTDELAGKSGHPEDFRKPNSLAFEIMQRRLGISMHNLMYVGDNENKDHKAPLTLGMKAVWFNNEDAFRKMTKIMPVG
ncbi:MAG: ATP-grasp domain-containing protein [Butyrivibrio sp.]|nr:ATP-grasp domain-containing protein [Butyrivibrio sp.]